MGLCVIYGLQLLPHLYGASVPHAVVSFPSVNKVTTDPLDGVLNLLLVSISSTWLHVD